MFHLSLKNRINDGLDLQLLEDGSTEDDLM